MEFANQRCRESFAVLGEHDEHERRRKGNGVSFENPVPLEPYPGGKSAVADMVWARLGNVANYLEPFAGSLATLLRRPADHFANGYRVETVNDANSYLVNFWRCLEKGLHAEVAKHADWPVMEADLHARHRWLVRSDEAHGWRTQFVHDPDFCDPKIAGWWCWGSLTPSPRPRHDLREPVQRYWRNRPRARPCWDVATVASGA